jgi:hypothetical protein
LNGRPDLEVIIRGDEEIHVEQERDSVEKSLLSCLPIAILIQEFNIMLLYHQEAFTQLISQSWMSRAWSNPTLH